MTSIRFPWRCVLVLVTSGLLTACGSDVDSDQALQERVAAAITSASDLPAEGIEVSVQAGVVTLSGSLDCEACGGAGTPGGAGTIQQSLGAVVRAVPGVAAVQFEFD